MDEKSLWTFKYGIRTEATCLAQVLHRNGGVDQCKQLLWEDMSNQSEGLEVMSF